MRTLLADGKARSAEELCAAGIREGLLADGTIPNYVRNSIKTLLDRQRDRGEAPEFVQLRDGRYRLDVPVDAFAAHDDPVPSDHAVETLIARLAASALRKAALQSGGRTEHWLGGEGRGQGCFFKGVQLQGLF
ncbi:MAG TPA: hypothetical protein VGC72_04635 [Candidatus Elarobacter sp.]